ncbi:PAS domain-containing protein [Pedobacter westerhofensis]|nr:PAS domain-containing protein [Pedobacter westerhofensis]
MENNLAPTNLSPDDKRRVEALKRYQILGTPPEQTFDNIARLATQIFDLPVSLISFIDTENVFLKSNVGVEEIRNSPRSNSICTMALGTDEVMVVEDIPNLSRHLMTDPLLVAEMGFKFHAGAPLITHDGFTIGTICVIGRETRTFSEKETTMLKGLARIVMDEIELRLRGIFDAEKRVMDAARLAQLNFNNQSLIAKAPMAIGVLNGRSLVIELANPIILEVWGKTDEVIGKTLKEALPEIEGQGFLQILDNVFTSGIPYYGKEICVFLMRNGVMEDVYFNFVYQPLQDGDGNTTSIMIVANEITEEMHARKALQNSEKQLENMVMNSASGMAIFSGKELIVEAANQQMFDIWCKTGEQILGRSLFDIFPDSVNPASTSSLTLVLETRETANFPEAEVTLQTTEGPKDLILNISYVPVFDDDGEVHQIIASVSDITNIVNARRLLERMESDTQTNNELLTKSIQELTSANKDMRITHEDLVATQNLLRDMLSKVPENQTGLYHSLQKIEESIQKAEDVLHSYVDTSTVGIWHVDVNTLNCVASPGLNKLYGFPTDHQFDWQEAIALISDPYGDKIMQAIRNSIDKNEPFSLDFPLNATEDHQQRWLRAFGKLDYVDGKATQLSGVTIEIPNPGQNN